MHPGKDRSLAGDVGGALHAGYQDYLVHGDRDKALLALALAYPIDLNDNPMKPRSLEACIPTLDAMMDSEYLMEYELAKVDCIDGLTRPATEVYFKINIKNFSLSDNEFIPVSYVGYIDAILYNHLTDEYIVCDIKTHTDKSYDLSPKYQFSPQCLPYGIVLERMLGQQLDGLSVKYLSTFIDIAQPKVAIYDFEKSKQDIEDWARGLIVDLQQIKMFYQMQWFPRTADGCIAWFKPCRFFDICESRDDDYIQQMILENKEPYTDRTDEPWIECDLELGI